MGEVFCEGWGLQFAKYATFAGFFEGGFSFVFALVLLSEAC
jgi:hypothetical protein